MPVSAVVGGIGDLLASLAAPAAVDAGAAAATDVGLGAATDLGAAALPSIAETTAAGADLASQLGTIALPTISNVGDLGAAAAGGALDLGGAASAPLDILADTGAATGAGAGLSDVLGAGALGAGLGGLGSALSSVPGALGSLFVSPAAAAEAPSAAAGAPTLGATGGAAPGAAGAAGGALGGAGGSAAGAAAPTGANDVVASDFGALSFAPTAGSSSPAGIPTTSPSGQPLSATAADPTTIASLGGGAGPGDLSTIGPGVSATGGTIGDNAPLTLGGSSGNPLSGVGGWITNNPLGAAGLGLGAANILKQLLFPAKLPYQQQQEQIAAQAQQNAGQLTTAGQQDLSYQQNGTLPPGMQAQVTQALNDAIAASNSKYASLGLGNSTMAQQEQQYLTLQSQALAGQLQQQLAQTGTQLISDATSDLSVAGNIYSSLMQSQISQDTALETSVSQFAGSMALASVLGGKTAAKPTVTS